MYIQLLALVAFAATAVQAAGPAKPPPPPPSTTLTGIAATAPTTPPSKLTGKLPTLGWNTWYAYQTDIDEEKVLAAANQLVSLGLKDVGFEYVNIDDAWSQSSGRDPKTNRILPNFTRFPDGIDGLANKVHDLGLKFGIYSDAGTETCAGYPGSLGNEQTDAQTFSDWGLDYLKYDNCNVPANWTDAPVPQNNDWYNSNSAIRYRQMTAALAKVPRIMQFELCIWGTANVWDWGARVGHSWRIANDGAPTWDYISSVINVNVAHNTAVDFFSHNDMDMIQIGNGDLTIQEQRTNFASWAFLKSPILIGTDMSKLSAEQLTILRSRELLAFNQDETVGTPAKPFNPTPPAPPTTTPEYFAGTSSRGVHIFIINTSPTAAMKQFTFSSVPGLGKGGSFKVHDMWNSTDLPGTHTAASTFTVSVDAHDTVAYLITKA